MSKYLVKQLGGVEDLLLGLGSANQERASGVVVVRKINASILGGTYVVETIAELLAIDPSHLGNIKSCTVTGIGGGLFIYDALLANTNDTGLVFNGWVRDFTGSLDVTWFGAIGDAAFDSTLSIQNTIDKATQLGVSVYIPDGEYLTTDEITISTDFIGQSKNGVIFTPDNITSAKVTKYKYHSGTNKKMIAYEATTKAVFNLDGKSKLNVKNFFINGRTTTITDGTVNTLPDVTGIRAGRADNSLSTPAFTRSSLENIKIRGCHTGLDITGFILNFYDIFIYNTKYGLVASEFNNIKAYIYMESVVKALNIAGAGQVVFTSFMNEGAVTCEPSELDAARAIIFTGLYLEGNTYNDSVFKFGSRVPEDNTLDIDFMTCKNITMLTTTLSAAVITPSIFKLDRIRGFKADGAIGKYDWKTIISTQETYDVDLSMAVTTNSFTTTNGHGNNLNISAPIQYAPNNTFKYKYSGYSAADVGDNVAVEWLKSDGNIAPLTGGHMLKMSAATNTETLNRLIFELRRDSLLPEDFKAGDKVTFGAWVYVKNQGYDPTDITNNPYIVLASYSATSGVTEVSKLRVIRQFDDWVFVYQDMVLTGDANRLYMQVLLSNTKALAIGTHIYVDSIYLCKGDSAGRFMKEGTLKETPSKYGVDTGSYMFYDTKVTGAFLTDRIKGLKGDRFNNPYRDSVPGSLLEVECQTDGDLSSTTKLWKPITLPATVNMPTAVVTDWGTCWLNTGVLTLNNP